MKLEEEEIEKAMNTLFKCGMCGEDEKLRHSGHLGSLRVCESCMEKYYTIQRHVLPLSPLPI